MQAFQIHQHPNSICRIYTCLIHRMAPQDKISTILVQKQNSIRYQLTICKMYRPQWNEFRAVLQLITVRLPGLILEFLEHSAKFKNQSQEMQNTTKSKIVHHFWKDSMAYTRMSNYNRLPSRGSSPFLRGTKLSIPSSHPVDRKCGNSRVFLKSGDKYTFKYASYNAEFGLNSKIL